MCMYIINIAHVSIHQSPSFTFPSLPSLSSPPFSPSRTIVIPNTGSTGQLSTPPEPVIPVTQNSVPTGVYRKPTLRDPHPT